MLQAYPFSILVALLLASHGYRKGSLSTSGAIAAFFIGYLTLACPVRAFGVTLLSFYIIGSRATKVGHQIKAKLEREYIERTAKGNKVDAKASGSSGHKAKSGGKRDWVQVCCNGLLGAVCAVAFRSLYWDLWQNGYAWCLLRSSRPKAVSFLGFKFTHEKVSLLPRSLFLFMLGHFAVSRHHLHTKSMTAYWVFGSVAWETHWLQRLAY